MMTGFRCRIRCATKVAIVSGNERDDHPQGQQQRTVGLNGRKRRGPVCKPDGADEPAKADVAQRLLRGRRVASDGGPA